MSSVLAGPSWPILFGGALLAIWAINKLFTLPKHKLPLPPGPKGLPIVGNVLDLPPPGGPEWKHWIKHKDLYGPISSVTTLGTTIVLIHDKEIALELLEKRSSKYSSRPFMLYASEMCDYKQMVGFQPNNDNFRAQRRLMAGQIGSKSSMIKFQSAVEFQVRHFLLRTMNNPESLVANLEAEAGSFMLETLYGYTSEPTGRDPLIELINRFMYEFGVVSVPGTQLVDIFPFLRYLPEWLPGSAFKKMAKAYRKTLHDVTTIPYDFTERHMKAGTAKPTFVQGLLKSNPDAFETKMIRDSAQGLYAGGADTTVAALSGFFLAMTLFPEVQQRAREEIDRVTGGTRLPDFRDRDKLPYIDAAVKEALRWHPIGPLGLPHATDEDDEFRGYRIPKGAVIVPSIAWFTRDPEVYHDPEVFKPERFLGPNPEPNPWAFVFGFGRRICPGRHLADSNLFLVLAQSLASLDIKKAVDKETGKVIEPLTEALPGVVMHPSPYQARIVPRSDKYAELIRSIEIEQPWNEGNASELRGLD